MAMNCPLQALNDLAVRSALLFPIYLRNPDFKHSSSNQYAGLSPD
jgi:hypothetical protein